VYEQVALAYIAGLEKYAANGGDRSASAGQELGKMASVASFFISRIDTAVDALIAAKLKASTNTSEQTRLRSLMGKVAIANAKVTYQKYGALFSGPRWQALADKGAHPQRVLWASTSTKNPDYRDVIYVEELIGRDTVNTIPPATFDAFRDHGRVRPSLMEDPEAAYETMKTLAQVGISMEAVTATLLEDGVGLFAEAFHKLLSAVNKHGQTSGAIVTQALA
jgi:transaldolase/glucose-6-phosphate isomerase